MRTLVLIAVLATSAAAEDARIRSHDIRLKIDPATGSFEATDTLFVTGPGTVDARPQRKGVKLTKLTLEDVVVEGSALNLAKGVHKITVVWKGSMKASVQKQKGPTWVAGDTTSGTIGEKGSYLPGGFYVPSKHPALFSVTIEVPLPHKAVSQGVRRSETTKDGWYSVRYEGRSPVDQLVVVTGPYEIDEREIGDTTCRTYLYAEERKFAKLLLDSVEVELPRYEAQLGKLPGGRFDVVENFFATGYGFPEFTLLGQSVIQYVCSKAVRQGAKTLPAGYLDHELVHCWLGNYALVDYEKGNWCEALTTYLSNYGASEREKRDAAYRRKVSRMYSLKVRPKNEYPLLEFKSKVHDYENDIGYGKGSMVFHMFRRKVGDAPFQRGLRKIVEQGGGKALGWNDVAKLMVEGSGSAEHRDWFKPWLERKGGPILEVGTLSVSGNRLVGTIRQTQDGPAYSLDVPVRITTADGVEDHIVAASSKESPFVLDLKAAPKKIELDPDHHVFRITAPQHVAPCLNAVLKSGNPVGWGDKEVLASMGVKATTDVGADVPSGYLVLGKLPDSAKALIAGGVTRHDKTIRVLADRFTIQGVEYANPESALVLSFRDKDGLPWTMFHANSEAGFARVRYLPYYGSDGYVVFTGRDVTARGDFPGDPRSRRTITKRAQREPEPLLRDLLWLTDAKFQGRKAGTMAAHKLGNELRGRLLQTGATYVKGPPVPVPYGNAEGPLSLVLVNGDKRTEIDTGFFPMHIGAPPPRPVVFAKVVEHPSDDVRDALVLLPEDADLELCKRYSKEGAAMLALVATDETMQKRANDAAWPETVPPALAERARANIEGIGRQAAARSRGPQLLTPCVYLPPKTADALKNSGGRGVFSYSIRWHTVTTSNIVARMGPDGPGVVLSAHWDGVGQNGSRIPQNASDNAAGVATLLFVAERLKRDADAGKLKRGVIFALFGAEEIGLLGSRWFTRLLPTGKYMAKPVAAVNVDGVGSHSKREVFLIGRSKYPKLFEVFEAARKQSNLTLGRDIDRFAYREGSDHWPLHEAGIPAVTIYTAGYRIMNTPLDTIDRVDMETLRRTARLTYRMIRDLATAETLALN
ncbi:MAG: M28 family peptidase [Planctomycetota bacterium]